jgi:hypothetical protein
VLMVVPVCMERHVTDVACYRSYVIACSSWWGEQKEERATHNPAFFHYCVLSRFAGEWGFFWQSIASFWCARLVYDALLDLRLCFVV